MSRKFELKDYRNIGIIPILMPEKQQQPKEFYSTLVKFTKLVKLMTELAKWTEWNKKKNVELQLLLRQQPLFEKVKELT